MGVAERYARVLAEVQGEVEACGRSKDDVLLISVSKTVGVDVVADAVEEGAHDFGENRPDCIVEKASILPDETWHFIGNVQSRRIPDIVSHAALIHSIFKADHILAVERAAAVRDKVQDILIEVNVSGEESKGGCEPSQAFELVSLALEQPHVRPCGLMTMAPLGGNMDEARATFDGLSALRQQIAEKLDPQQAADFKELSMGMSQDWRQAVAAGATMVRIGRAVFDDAF